MAHINFTPLTTLAFDTLDHWERAYHVAVIRATCDLTDGSELHLAAEQTPVAAADDYFGEPACSGLRWESDLAPFPRSADFGLRGCLKTNPLILSR